ncbi:site-2 protease family protein [Streptomyces sp. H51]|uniref:site-2 protease family protein n=1 Tax=Streptomyces sp. H51 TaxID=3111770 RepID=UPI002D793856|nr:site-2 protease family protein [Streptomyces sp. H51]
MDESGGSGQPRTGTDESADHLAGTATPADTDGGTTAADDTQTPTTRPAPTPTPAGEPAEAAPPSGGNGVTARTEDGSPASAPRSTDTPQPDPGTGGPAPSAGPPAHPATLAEHRPAPAEDAAEQDRPSGHRPDTPPTTGDPARGDHPAPADRPAADRPAPADRPARPDHPAAPRPTRAGSRTPAHSAGGGAKNPPPQRPEPRGGLLMGRPFGVPVYVAPSWFLVAALITWVFGGQLERVLPELGAARYLVSLFFAVAFYASVLVHELAHTVAALRYKLPVRRIQLQFFGGVSEIEKEAETPGREFVLAFVGPLLSLVLAGVFYLAMQPVEPGTVPGVLLAGLMVSNLIVAVFNLLPGLPLDGGRMLRAVVWKITGKPMSGTVAAAWVGRALAVSVLIGLPLLTQSGALGSNAEDNVGMDTVTDALLAAILAAIIWTGAGNSLRMARLREHLPELRARNLTRRAVPVETDTPLSEALRRANAAGARALVVVDPDGTPLSLVREAAIVGVPEHRRPWVAVSGLAQELTDGMRVSAELAGEDLLDALRATPATEYLVVEETGEIYGVLSAADVERAFVKAMARPS